MIAGRLDGFRNNAVQYNALSRLAKPRFAWGRGRINGHRALPQLIVGFDRLRSFPRG
jgi:hypothetical protein